MFAALKSGGHQLQPAALQMLQVCVGVACTAGLQVISSALIQQILQICADLLSVRHGGHAAT